MYHGMHMLMYYNVYSVCITILTLLTFSMLSYDQCVFGCLLIFAWMWSTLICIQLNTLILMCDVCISRIARMVRQPRGNALLVGVGGTGKQSLTRLASHMCGYKCFQIELTRGYNYESFHEDLKKLYIMTGVKDENTVFLFTDTQVPSAPP